MISVKEHYSLTELNTFQIIASAKYYVELSEPASVKEFLKSGLTQYPSRFVLGGGSNVLFTGNFEGIIIRPMMRGIEKIDTDGADILIRVGAGEIWDDLVAHCVNNEWAGLENLSWIPGNVGACPVQNIGAYGVEVKDYIENAEGFYIDSGEPFVFTAKECAFSYRNSIFKNALRNNVVITHVTFRLHKTPQFQLHYPDLKKEISDQENPTLQEIRDAIIRIRKRKLPDPNETGNAGSFFKNPILPREKVIRMQQMYPGMPVYESSQDYLKISAAWLIDQSGWKGKTHGKAGTHPNQPLILINLGGARGHEVLECAKLIQNAVMSQFGVPLEMEVNVL